MKAIESIPDSQLLLFKSCMVGQEYPGVETSTRYVFDRIGVDYCINDEQSCCTGIGHYTDIFEGLTTIAIAARNFAVARRCGYPNITCLCSTCYAINKEACEVLNTNTEVRERINAIFREQGLENLVYEKDDMNPRTNFYHAVEILLSKVNEIKKQKKFDFSGTKAAAHHACHYYKVKYLDVLGNPENPQLIDTIAAVCGADPVRWYEDRTLTAGWAFPNSTSTKTPRFR